MSFGTKKIRKFLSLSLITSSFCLPWFSKVNAGLKGRIATMEDFRKFTSELKYILKESSKYYDKKKIKKYCNMVTNNEKNKNLKVAGQILEILEKNGIKSDILMIERSVGKEKSSYASVIYPISNKLGEIQFFIIDPVKLLRCYFGTDGSLMLESWRDYCCLDIDDYLSSKTNSCSWLEKDIDVKISVPNPNNEDQLLKVGTENLMDHYLSNTTYPQSAGNVRTRVFVHNNDKKLGEMNVKYWILNAMGATKKEDQRKICNLFGINSCAIY